MQPHRAWTLPGLLLVAACAGSDDSSAPGTADSGPVTSGTLDAGTFTFSDDASTDGGPLLTSCNPGSPSSCGPGFVCFAQHTSASWWVDLYGTCTFDCTSQTLALCSGFDGVCACPVPQGATQGSCSPDGGVGGTAMVCVPAVKPGTTPGAGEGDGGCGTPGCGGGPPPGEAGAIGAEDAGD